MDTNKRLELQRLCNPYGFIVVKREDHDSMLLNLARMTQFHRLMHEVAAGNPVVEVAVEHVLRQQSGFPKAIPAPVFPPTSARAVTP